MIKRFILLLILLSILGICGTVSATNIDIDDSQKYHLFENTIQTSDNDITLETSISNNSNDNKNFSSTKSTNNELFVRFRFENPSSSPIALNLHAQVNATVLNDYTEISGLQLVKIPENMYLIDAINIYSQSSHVLYAEPNNAYQISLIPNDPGFNNQWGLYNNGQIVYGLWGTAGSDINAINAWDITTGSSNVIIAVLDTGIDLNHVDLRGNLWINRGEILNDGIDNDGNGYIDDYYGWDFYNNDNDPSDDNGHGTGVAGVIAAFGNNSRGITGVMWNAQIMALKFLDKNGYGTDEDALRAILYANKMGAHIINNSWNGGNYSKVLKDAISKSNALIVCAAGNNGMNNDIFPDYPASYTSSNIISVAATDMEDYITYFSNYGISSVDVAAPGINIYTTRPGNRYGYFTGTSMSAAFVSGLAGLIKSLRPDLTNIQIKNTIMNNVDVKSSLIGKILTGGRINAYKSLINVITILRHPRILSTDPAKEEVGVPLNKVIKIYFNENITKGINFKYITLNNAKGKSIKIQRSINGNILIIIASKLDYGTKYTLNIPAGSIRNVHGNYLRSKYSYSFCTVSKYSTFLKVQNRGSSSIHFIYYAAITQPGMKTIYKRLSGTLNPGRTTSINIGKHPLGTKILLSEYIYNKNRYMRTINIKNIFMRKKMKLLTQKIYMKWVKASPGKIYKRPVYTYKLIQITSYGLKIRIISPPHRLRN
ncbi:MAG: S8 family serine peptidase [Methanobacteriaceae archaeon]|nr:S8 family serine peptidase [Methanobacteriaceae archaeon]